MSHLHDGALAAALDAGLHSVVAVESVGVLYSVTRDRDPARSPVVQLRQCHLQGVLDVVALLRTLRALGAPATTASEEGTKEVLGAATAAALRVVLEAVLTVRVVDLLLLLVREDLVRELDLLERLLVACDFGNANETCVGNRGDEDPCVRSGVSESG